MSLMQEAGGLPPQICAYINRIYGYGISELQQVVKDEGLTGLQLAAVWEYAPAWFFDRAHAKKICQTVTNYTHPQHSGECFASNERLITASNANQTALDRFLRGIGSLIFKSRRQFNKPTVRTLSTPALRFLLIGRAIIRASLSENLTSNLFERLTRSVFQIKPAPAKKPGRPAKKTVVDNSENADEMPAENGEELKEPQPPTTSKVTALDLRAKELVNNSPRGLLSGLANAIRQFVKPSPKRRKVPNWKRQARDINQLSEPDTHVPDGFRGAEFTPATPTQDCPAKTLTADERATVMLFVDSGTPLPEYLLAKCLAAGETELISQHP